MQTRTQVFTSAAEVPHSTRQTCNRYENSTEKRQVKLNVFNLLLSYYVYVPSSPSLRAFLWTCVIRRFPEELCFQIQGWCVQWVLAPLCTDFQGWAEKHSSVKMSIYEDRKIIWLDFFFQVYTLESLFPVIIISLNIVEGSGILGQKISLFLQHTHTHTKPQHIMFRRDSDTGNTLEVPCGVKSCYTTSYGKFKPSFKYFSGK